MRHLEKFQILRSTVAFAGWGEDQLRRLTTLVDEVCVPAGTVIARQGRLCHEFVIVASGVLETCRSGRAGRLGRGETFGWEAMWERGEHDATVHAVTSSHLLVMSHRQFQTAAAIASDRRPRIAWPRPFEGPPSPAGPSPTGSPGPSLGAQKRHADPGC